MKQHYLGLLLFAGILLSQVSSAQQLPTKVQSSHPGGVKGAKAWFVSQALPDGSNGIWVDKSGNGLILKQGEQEVYKWTSKEHNFHQSLLFYRDDVYFDIPNSSGRQLTTFGIFNPYNHTNSHLLEHALYDLVSFGNDQSFSMTTDKLYSADRTTRIDYGSEVGSDLWFRKESYQQDNSLKYHTTKLLTHYKAATPNHSVWGETEHLRIFINRNRAGVSKMWYFIPEFIMYDRLLRPVERMQVESYMARKYAMPLERSFLSASGNLMWDYIEEVNYNNRVFYVGREDSSDLYQPRAVSTYEHYRFNNVSGNESFLGTGGNTTSDNRHWSSKNYNRLLIFGVQELDPTSYQQNGDYFGIANDDYYMLGDDAGDLAITENQNTGLAGVNLSGRTWKMKTNVRPSKKLLPSWKETSKLYIKEKENQQQMYASAMSRWEEHRMFTETTASHGDASIEFDLATIQRDHKGTIKIGFASSNGNSSEVYYGFQISESGIVFTIEKGRMVAALDPHISTRNRRFKIAIEGHQVVFYYQYPHLSLNLPLKRIISLEASDLAKLNYGLIHYKSNLFSSLTEDETLLLSHLSTEGFTQNTGARTRLELRGTNNENNDLNSNGMQGLPEINPLDNQTVWLLVDPTGKGDFASENVTYYKADEIIAYNEGRYIFDDVQWDEDGSGEDVFTFGYSTGSILARIESFHYECDQNGELTSQGHAKVYLEQGDSIYHAIDVYNSTDSLIHTQEIFLREELEIPLEAGDYRIDITNKQSQESVSEQVSILDYCEELGVTEPEQPEANNTSTPPAVLTVYPNPARPNTPFNAETELEKPATVTYLLFNQLGVLIEQREGTYSSDFHKDQFTLPRVGVYIIKVITSDGKEINRKVLVN